MKSLNFVGLLCACLVSILMLDTVRGAEGKDAKPAVDELFAQPKVLQLKIEIPAASLNALKMDSKKYARATVREGDKVYAEAGVRLKGNGSFQPLEKKPSLTIKFNEFVSGERFHGHGKVFLNSSAHDPSYLTEAIAGEIFRAADVPAPKITFARIELNGRDLGLYVLSQASNREFLSEYFKKAKGNFYEGSNADVNEKLEKDSGDDSKDQADLKALANAAKEQDPAQRLKKLGALLDIDRFISFAAVEVFTWHHSGYTMGRNNYRVYHDPASNQMVFIPHGLDQVFNKTSGPLTPEWKGLVAKAILETPDGQRRYRERMTKLLATAFKPDVLQARVNDWAGKVRPAIARDAAASKSFDAAVARWRERIAERAKFIELELKKSSS